jgi:hypothetical protein
MCDGVAPFNESEPSFLLNPPRPAEKKFERADPGGDPSNAHGPGCRSLNGTGHLREHIICIGPNKADSTYHDDQYDSQHYGIFRDILGLFFAQEPMDGFVHLHPPITC